jgi:hypothetical protein
MPRADAQGRLTRPPAHTCVLALPKVVVGRPLVDANVVALFFVPCPLACGVAILRYRLFDVAINRALVYNQSTRRSSRRRRWTAGAVVPSASSGYMQQVRLRRGVGRRGPGVQRCASCTPTDPGCWASGSLRRWGTSTRSQSSTAIRGIATRQGERRRTSTRSVSRNLRIRRGGLGNALSHAVLTGWLAFVLFPLYWLITMSLRPAIEIFARPPKLIGFQPTLDNYIAVLNLAPIGDTLERHEVSRRGGDCLAI